MSTAVPSPAILSLQELKEVSIGRLAEMAKAYAIAIMEDLINEEMIRKDFQEADEQKAIQELVSKKNGFDIPTHKADNQNRIKSQQRQQQSK